VCRHLWICTQLEISVHAFLYQSWISLFFWGEVFRQPYESNTSAPLRIFRIRLSLVCIIHNSYNYTMINYFNRLYFFNLQTFLHLYTCVSGCFWFLAGPIEPSWCCFCVEPGSRPTSRSFGASKAGALSVFSENSEGLSALDTAQNLFLVRLGHRGPNLAIYIANGG
jgi:hypothetical protein